MSGSNGLDRPTKEITLRTGRVVTVMMPGVLDCGNYQEMLKADHDAPVDAANAFKGAHLKATVQFLCDATIDPKLVADKEKATGGAIFWDNWLGFDEFVQLTQTLMLFSGMTQVAEKVDPTLRTTTTERSEPSTSSSRRPSSDSGPPPSSPPEN